MKSSATNNRNDGSLNTPTLKVSDRTRTESEQELGSSLTL